MAPDSGTIRLGKAFSFSWETLRNNLLPLLALSGLNTIPTLLLPRFMGTGPIPPGDPIELLTRLLVVLLAAIVSGCLAIVSSMAMAAVVENSVLERVVSLRESLARGFGKFAAGASVALLGGLIVLGLTLLLVVPGIIWGLYYLFLYESVVLRDLSGMEALRYSKRLVQGNWWNVFGIMLVCSGSLALLLGLSAFLSALLLGRGVLALAVQLVASTFVLAFFHVLRTLLFLALERMKGVGSVHETQ